MRRLLQNKSIVASLVAVAVLCIAANFVMGLKRPASVVSARVTTEPDATVVSCPIRLPSQIATALSDWQYDASLKEWPARDPFRRVHRSPAPSPNSTSSLVAPVFTVQAISIEAERAFAVINRRVLAPGESIDGYVVERIQPTQVWLSGPSGRLVLPVQRTIRRPENVATGK